LKNTLISYKKHSYWNEIIILEAGQSIKNWKYSRAIFQLMNLVNILFANQHLILKSSEE
jgi:hypothetical protein